MLAVRRGGSLKQLEEWSRLSTTETTSKAAEYLVRAGFRIRGRLTGERSGGCGSSTPGGRRTSRAGSANRRSESAWHLRTLLEEGRIRLIQHEGLFVQLLAHGWHADGAGR